MIFLAFFLPLLVIVHSKPSYVDPYGSGPYGPVPYGSGPMPQNWWPGGSLGGGQTYDRLCAKRYDYNPVKLTWNYARLSCRAKGGVLASVQSNLDSAIFKSRFGYILKKDAWIGASERRKKGHWEWEKGQFMPKEVMYFTNWARREPKWGQRDTSYCLLLVEDAEWEAEDCNKLKPSICEYSVCGGNMVNDGKDEPTKRVNPAIPNSRPESKEDSKSDVDSDNGIYINDKDVKNDRGEYKPSLISNIVPGVSLDFKPSVNLDVTPDVTPDATPDRTPDVPADVTPDVTPDVTTDVAPDVTPVVIESVVPANSTDDINSTATDSVNDLSGDASTNSSTGNSSTGNSSGSWASWSEWSTRSNATSGRVRVVPEKVDDDKRQDDSDDEDERKEEERKDDRKEEEEDEQKEKEERKVENERKASVKLLWLMLHHVKELQKTKRPCLAPPSSNGVWNCNKDTFPWICILDCSPTGVVAGDGIVDKISGIPEGDGVIACHDGLWTRDDFYCVPAPIPDIVVPPPGLDDGVDPSSLDGVIVEDPPFLDFDAAN